MADYAESEGMYCPVHPTEPTALRCNKCDRPMCIRCATLTPVGYRCKECIRSQLETFYNALPFDPLIQIAICVPLSAVAAFLISAVSSSLFMFYYLGYLVSGAASWGAGALIASLAYRAVDKRRGRYSWLVVAAAIVAGAFVPALIKPALMVMMTGTVGPAWIMAAIFSGIAGFYNIGWWIYLVASAAAAVNRLRLGR